MATDAVKKATRDEWRRLGFFYELDDQGKCWRIVGTAAGLKAFAELISDYASNPKHDGLSEHEHYGPHMYLEVGTWSEPEITGHWIAGPRTALASLAQAIGQSIVNLGVERTVSLRAAFAPTSEYDLVLELRDEPFDPAREDRQCW